MIKNPILSIAKKEILDNIRNKWIIVISFIFTLLTLVTSYFGSLTSQGWQDFGITIAGMEANVQYVLTIIALMLGYAAIIGEIERGSMSSLLTLPVKRLEILLGKFLGLGCILSLTILIGFGVAGIVIAVNVSEVNYLDYLVFIGATILFGLVFLSLALFFSSIFKRRSTAMGGAIFLWFLFLIILPMIFAGLLISSVGIDALTSSNVTIPNWYYSVELMNPISVYSYLITLAIGPVASSMQQAITITYPSYFTPALMIGILLLWIIVFQLLAYWRFRRTDI